MAEDRSITDIFDQLIADEEKKDYPTKSLTIRALKEGKRLCKRNIPKKAETVYSVYTHDDGAQEAELDIFCPNCDKLLAVIRKGTCIKGELSAAYCSRCAQALDWSEVEE